MQVYDGEDAVFSLILSTVIQGTWFLNGVELQSAEPEGQVEPGALRYHVEHRGLQHLLVLHAVTRQHSGALIGFSCLGVQDSAALTIQGWCWWALGWAHTAKAQSCWHDGADAVPTSTTWARRVRSARGGLRWRTLVQQAGFKPHATYRGPLAHSSVSYPDSLGCFVVYRILSCLSSQRHRPEPLGP